MKTETFQKIYIVSVIFLILFLCFVMWYVYSNKQVVLRDPMNYAMNKRFSGEVRCTCSHIWDGGKHEIWGFNNTHSWLEDKWYSWDNKVKNENRG